MGKRHINTDRNASIVLFESRQELIVTPRTNKSPNRGQALESKEALVCAEICVGLEQLKAPLGFMVERLAQLTNSVDNSFLVQGRNRRQLLAFQLEQDVYLLCHARDCMRHTKKFVHFGKLLLLLWRERRTSSPREAGSTSVPQDNGLTTRSSASQEAREGRHLRRVRCAQGSTQGAA